MIIYISPEITVRELEERDQILLVKWLSDPEVLSFYEGRDRPHDLELVRERFYQEDEEVRCIVEYNNEPIGYIQYYELEEEEQRDYGYPLIEKIYGTDQFIGEPRYWNRGIGTQLVKSMLNYLIHELKADRVVMDPQQWNTRAITCYEKCGYKKVKELKRHEMHEGELRDCWLMEYTKNG